MYTTNQVIEIITILAEHPIVLIAFAHLVAIHSINKLYLRTTSHPLVPSKRSQKKRDRNR